MKIDAQRISPRSYGAATRRRRITRSDVGRVPTRAPPPGSQRGLDRVVADLQASNRAGSELAVVEGIRSSVSRQDARCGSSARSPTTIEMRHRPERHVVETESATESGRLSGSVQRTSPRTSESPDTGRRFAAHASARDRRRRTSRATTCQEVSALARSDRSCAPRSPSMSRWRQWIRSRA
jgi:hypothetical protein